MMSGPFSQQILGFAVRSKYILLRKELRPFLGKETSACIFNPCGGVDRSYLCSHFLAYGWTCWQCESAQCKCPLACSTRGFECLLTRAAMAGLSWNRWPQTRHFEIGFLGFNQFLPATSSLTHTVRGKRIETLPTGLEAEDFSGGNDKLYYVLQDSWTGLKIYWLNARCIHT